MRDVYIVGIGTTQFAKHLDKSVKDLAGHALTLCLEDAGINNNEIQAVHFSNTNWGYQSGQHCIRGQVALRGAGIMGIPIYNHENACASGSTAFHSAWLSVASGYKDCTLALGAEKMYDEDKVKMFKSFFAGMDVENMIPQMEALSAISDNLKLEIPGEYSTDGAGKDKSAFMDVYSAITRWHMDKYGTTQKQLAMVASKNHFHSSLNPNAQFQNTMSVDEILNARMVSWPLTVPMCAPVGDGGAAALICSKEYLEKLPDSRPVKIRASVLGSGTDRRIDEEHLDISFRLSTEAYEMG